MIEKNYYYLTSSLPSLSFDKKPEITTVELNDILNLNLTSEDKELFIEYKKIIDLLNIKRIWRKKTIDKRGFLDEKKLNEALLVEEFFPEIVFKFIKKNNEEEEKKNNFYKLLIEFLNFQIDNLKDGFVKDYYIFYKKYHFIQAFLRSKIFGEKDIEKELYLDDKTDFFIKSLLEQSKSNFFSFDYEFDKLKDVFIRNKENPYKLYKNSMKFRFNYIEEMIQKKLFKIDYLIGYYINLCLVEDYNFLNENMGIKLLEEVL